MAFLFGKARENTGFLKEKVCGTEKLFIFASRFRNKRAK